MWLFLNTLYVTVFVQSIINFYVIRPILYILFRGERGECFNTQNTPIVTASTVFLATVRAIPAHRSHRR